MSDFESTAAADHRPTALVLGATGGIGGEVARGLVARGWAVRALHRDPVRARAGKDVPAGLEWCVGDAMRAADVLAAASGVDLIVHGVNPPGYARWGELVLPMIDNTIAAARASGATVLLPGTVYNFGPDVFANLHEDAPQNPKTVKGAIRVELERRLKAAAGDGVRTIIVRAGDFFGPRAGNSWFAQGLVTAGKPVKRVIVPNSAGVGHQWAYLPDVAETMLRLVERRADTPAFAPFHMAGHWDPDGRAMVQAIVRAVGRPDMPTWRFPWWILPLASPFVTFMRELREMRYLWQVPLRMDVR